MRQAWEVGILLLVIAATVLPISGCLPLLAEKWRLHVLVFGFCNLFALHLHFLFHFHLIIYPYISFRFLSLESWQHS